MLVEKSFDTGEVVPEDAPVARRPPLEARRDGAEMPPDLMKSECRLRLSSLSIEAGLDEAVVGR